MAQSKSGLRNMTVGSPAGHIFYFALPLLAGSFLQQLYNMVDSFVVGKYVGDSALAAVGVGFPVIFMFTSLFMGLSNGGTVVIAQFYGAGRMDRVRDAVDTIYTSFVCAAGGYSLGMFALFYYLIDVRQWRRWTYFFKVIGVNSITIYLGQQIISFSYTSKFFFGGLAAKLPPAIFSSESDTSPAAGCCSGSSTGSGSTSRSDRTEPHRTCQRGPLRRAPLALSFRFENRPESVISSPSRINSNVSRKYFIEKQQNLFVFRIYSVYICITEPKTPLLA